MASDILITPNKGSAVTNAKIEFTGATSESSTMRIEVLTNGALSFIGSSGTAGIGIDGSIAGTFGSYSSYLTMGSLVANDPGASYYAFGHRIGGTLGISQGVSIGSGGAAAPSNGLLVGGNVGIGATAPSTVLDVDINRASQTDGIRIKNSNTGGYGHELNFNLYGYAGSTVGSFDVLSMRTQYNGTTGYVTFLTKAQPESTAVQSLFLQGDGNVGIGTSVFSVYSNFVGIQKDQSAPTRLLVSNQTNNASSSSELVVAAYGNSWVMGMGSSAKNSNALTWALDATAGTPSVKMTLNSSAGDLLLASTTAGASSVGALVVQGGISAGNTGAASYFGGTETYFQGSTGNTNLISTRAGTSNGATFQYKTGATLKWYHGLRGLVNDNFYIHNQSADVSALILDVATNAATFAGAVTATGTGAFGGSGSLGSTYLSRLSVFTAGAGNFSVGGQTNTNNTVVARMTAYNASNGNSGNGAATTFMGITSIESVVKTATNNAGEDSGGDLVFLTKGDGGTLTERMRLLSTGDVGIGTASPTYHLQVAGTGTQTSVASFRYDTGIIGEVGILSDATGGLLFARDGSGTSNTQINGKTNGHSYFNSGGSVCIGTTTPFGKFQLGPSNAVNTPISDILQLRYYDGDFYGSSAFHYYDNSQGMEKYVIGVSGIGGTLTGPNTIAQAKMVIQANGNVGIGTASPGAKLEVSTGATTNSTAVLIGPSSGTATLGDKIVLGFKLQNTAGGGTGNTYAAGIAGLQDSSGTNTGALGFYTQASLGDGTPERMRITSAGNVAIGTINTDPLSLSRDRNLAIVTTGTNAALTLVGGGAGRIDFGVGSTRTAGIYSDATNYTEIFTTTALPLVFSTNSVQRMHITSAGNVGIGTTNPITKLQVALPTQNYASFGNTGYGVADWYGLHVGYLEVNNSLYRKTMIAYEGLTDNAARGNLHLLVNTGNSSASATIADSKLMISGITGNVGIGTTSPTGNLEIAKTASGALGANLFLRNNAAVAAGNAVQISMCANSGGDATAPTAKIVLTEASNAYSKLGFFTYAADGVVERLTIANGGDVGIGTSPSYKLDVSGSIRAGSANQTALLVTASGTATTQAAIAIQQLTGEGDTIIFADYEPYAEYGIIARNSLDSIDFTGGTGTGSLDNYSVTNRAGTTRTAHVKARIGLGSGNSFFGGNVGIGTTSTGAKLDVFQAAGPQLRIYGNAVGANDAYIDFGADNAGVDIYGRIGIDVSTGSAGVETGGLFFSTINSGTLSKKVSILGDGNVGIGTTSPTTNKLTIVASSNQLGIGDGTYRYDISYDNSYLRFKNSAGDTQMVVNWSTGYVGIGTTSPGAKLTVKDGAIHLDKTNGLLYFTTDGAAGSTNSASFIGRADTAGYHVSSADGGFASLANSFVIGSQSGPLIFATTDAASYPSGRMIIDANGLVGIGIAVPTAPLHVSKAVNGDWVAKFVNTGTTPYGLSVDTSANAGTEYTFAAYTNAGTGLLLRNNGQLGIGTANPGYQLAVSNNGAAGIELGATNGNFGEIYAYNRTSSAYIPLILQAGGGNIGIGTTTPSNKLTVYDATAQAQAVFSGYSVVGARTNTDSGTIRIGTNAAFHGRMDYDAGGSTTLSIDNVYDHASAAIQFRLRTAGTPVTALSLSGSGTATFAGDLSLVGNEKYLTLNSDNTVGSNGRARFRAVGSSSGSGYGGSFVLDTRTSSNNYVTALSIDSSQAATFAGAVTTGGRIDVTGGVSGGALTTSHGQIGGTTNGLELIGQGVTNDVTIYNKNGSQVFAVPTGTVDLVFNNGAVSGISTLSTTGAATFAGAVTVSGTLTNTAAQLGTFTSTTANGTSGEGNFTVVSSNTNTDTAYGINRAPGIAIRNTSGTANSYGGISFQDGGSNATSSIFGIFENDANNTGSLQFATRPSGGSLTTALTLASTGAATFAGAVSDSIGDIRILPQNSRSAAYTTVLSDSGKHILHPSADTTARTITIDSNANVAYAIGTAITFINQNAAGALTIAITSDTMRLAGAGTTGDRTLAANGVATAVKITSTEWIISGTGLT